MENPYLKSNRLPDVIAAIQAMSIYKLYKLPFASWSYRISGTKENSEHWKAVFEEHPEFFRLDSERQEASLVWRRQFPKRYNFLTKETISQEQYQLLTEEEILKSISRNPLTPDDIKELIATAISLYSSAIEEKREKRWWVALSGGIGGFLGSLIGALLRSH